MDIFYCNIYFIVIFYCIIYYLLYYFIITGIICLYWIYLYVYYNYNNIKFYEQLLNNEDYTNYLRTKFVIFNDFMPQITES